MIESGGKSPPAIASSAEIGLQKTDEQAILLLNEYTPGSYHLNILDDTNPFERLPQNLPDGIWFLVVSDEKKENEVGFWKPIGEGVEIYSDTISGWRTTLEFFQGKSPYGQKTEWLMQEYRVTPKGICNEDKTKESKSLCRFFSCSNEKSPKKEMDPKESETDIDVKQVESAASTIQTAESTSMQPSISESEVKNDSEVELCPVVDPPPKNSSPEGSSNSERLLQRESDDLEDAKSQSSTLENSNSSSNMSDEYFDSLEDSDDEHINELLEIGSSSRHNFVKPPRKNVIIEQLAPSDSQRSATLTPSTLEWLLTSQKNEASLTSESVTQNTTRQKRPEDAAAPPTSHKEDVSNRKKKTGPDIMKMLNKYLCFDSF